MLESHYKYINDLVSQVQAEDQEALKELLQYFRPLIATAIRRCIGRLPALARYRDDIEAEVYGIFYDLVRQYDPNLSYFCYYISTRLDYALMTKARELVGAFGSEEVVFSDMPEGWEIASPDDPFGRIELRENLAAAMSTIKPAQREAIRLHYFENLNQQEAAAFLGITQGSFCKRLQRGLLALKKRLAADEME